MSGERLKDGVIHPVDMVARMDFRGGMRILALHMPRPFLPALHQASGRGGALETNARGTFDVVVLWDDDEHDLAAAVAEGAAHLGPSGHVWVFVRKPPRRGLRPGSVTPEALAAILAPHGLKAEVTLSAGPERYALRFGRPPAPAPAAGTRP